MGQASSNLSLILFFAVAIILLLSAIWYLMGSLKKSEAPDIDANSIYKKQLDELKQSLELGQIEQSDYENARLEIGRRMARNKRENVKISSPINPKFVAVLVGLVGLATVATYFFIGSPGFSDAPIAKREKELLARDPSTLNSGEIKLIIEQKMREKPNDAMPHLLMGKILAGEGRDDEALRAYQAALRRDDNNAETLAEIGGVIFRLSGNVPSPQSSGAIKDALELDKDNLTALFYSGQFKWAAGDKVGAMNIWRDAWQRFPSKDDSQPSQKQFGLLTRIVPEVSKIEKGPMAGGKKGPMGGGEAPFMAAMAAGDNPEEFIKTMVQNRVDALKQSPDDIGLRVSVIKVLLNSGKIAEAQKTYEEGINLFKNDKFKTQILEVAAMMLQAPASGQDAGKTAGG
jgi:cytochrome c-type biogenesis protein CcmH